MPCLTSATPTFFAMLVAAASLSLPGCAKSHSSRAGVVSDIAMTSRSRLTNTDNGLELRRWSVLDQPQVLRQVLARHRDGEALDAEALNRLRRNGFRFIRVPLEALPELLSDLGGASIDRTEWHGQVHVWPPLAQRPVAQGPSAPRHGRRDAASPPANRYGSGAAVAVDGRIDRYDRGEFRLLARSWTVHMEDGPFLHLELLPEHYCQPVND